MDGEAHTQIHPPENENENHVFRCHRCGWPFPNQHPSAKHRRAHKKVCGTLDGYRLSESERGDPESPTNTWSLKQCDPIESNENKDAGTEEDEFGDAVAESTNTVAALATASIEVEAATEPVEASGNNTEFLPIEALVITEDASGCTSALSPTIASSESNIQPVKIVMDNSKVCIGQETYNLQNEDSERVNLINNSVKVGDTEGEVGVKSDYEGSEVSEYPFKDIPATSVPGGSTAPLHIEKLKIAEDEKSCYSSTSPTQFEAPKAGLGKTVEDQNEKGEVNEDPLVEIGSAYETVECQNVKAEASEYPSKDITSTSISSNSTDSLLVETMEVTKDEKSCDSAMSPIKIETPRATPNETVEGQNEKTKVNTYLHADALNFNSTVSLLVEKLEITKDEKSCDLVRSPIEFEAPRAAPNETPEGQNEKAEANELSLADTSDFSGSLAASRATNMALEGSKDPMKLDIPLTSGNGELIEEKGNHNNDSIFKETHSCQLVSKKDEGFDVTSSAEQALKENLQQERGIADTVKDLCVVQKTDGSESKATTNELNNSVKKFDGGDPTNDNSVILQNGNDNNLLKHQFGSFDVAACRLGSMPNVAVDSSSLTDSLEGHCGSVSDRTLASTRDAMEEMNTPVQAQKANQKNIGTSIEHHNEMDIFEPPSFMTLVEPTKANYQKNIASGWFPSLNHIEHETKGRKKNEHIITEVTKSTGKPHGTLKNLLTEAKVKKYHKYSQDKQVNFTSSGNDTMYAVEVHDVKLDGRTELNRPQAFQENKREKNKTQGKASWASFLCCSSIS
ncbi:PREDICTED: uncharacterized protein LOC104612643 [Nelumbo nucifera]|uniref:Uncharacterized protein LOC104612643 n=2 Tax=Nelumbo nucifera TaxID=4432 RepID=A0A1U8BN11_NELNU|nr:PREDICTED: uncharacterized protein LOC104612643 [Nelumbo nucifera]DAD46342.1 TPA_asm: hypothetical protein HUJ06_004572 [Nelumbo nucifera]